MSVKAHTPLVLGLDDASATNDSLNGDYLWTSGNLGEAVPDVMTPCTWSLMQTFMIKTLPQLFITSHPPIGNIGGRCYMNLSFTFSMGAMLGLNRKRFTAISQEVFGRVPDDLEIPLLSLSRWKMLGVLIPTAINGMRRISANQKKLPAFFATASSRNEQLRARIKTISSADDLIKLWRTELAPYFYECCEMLEAGAKRDGNALIMTRNRLSKMVGETDANLLLFSGQNASHLASLGPLLSLTRLARGEIDRAAFAREYGHRGPHEFEVSMPRPAEDPDWIDQQLAGLRAAPSDAITLLASQKKEQEAAWQRFGRRFPRKVETIKRKIERSSAAARDREAARSEVIRAFWALRTFVLRAAELTGQGNDLFFLSFDEILAVLGGKREALASIPTRRSTYERYCALPTYPTLIRGHFDPFKWAANPRRRGDLFDEHGDAALASDEITGFPGSDGLIEGRARVILTPEEGGQLQPGEILVTVQTNIGWTPLFPRAAAVVTDVGAPLSHAAIVARELGIPAVVGCGNATMRLHTGDHVRVDGKRGTVEVLKTLVPDP